MANMLINDSELADHVVAKGTSGGWKYIKYANGLAQCWTTWTGTSDYYSTTAPGLPYAHYVSLDYPFSFVEVPTCTATCRVGLGFCYTFFSGSTNTTEHSCTVYFCSAYDDTDCDVRLMVQGLWKELT